MHLGDSQPIVLLVSCSTGIIIAPICPVHRGSCLLCTMEVLHAASATRLDGLPDQMQALIFQGVNSIALATVPTPTMVHDTDVLVRVTLCGICGSDLHPFLGRETGLAPGTIVGHEFVGVVAAVGDQVQQLHVGDRVMSPFTTNCGGCYYCSKGITCRCNHPQAHVFGWLSEGEDKLPVAERTGLQGSQAQFVRVPLADTTLVKVPEGVTDEEGILLGDILSTSFFCAENGMISDGSSVVVLGCGPVGLLTILAARHLGATQVWAVDYIGERLTMAEEFGAVPLDLSSDDVLAVVRQGTEGRGADVVLEVVGASSALKLAYDLLRPMGVLSSVGVHTAPVFPFSPVDGYNRNLTYRSGRCPARRYMDKLVPVVQAREHGFARIITHRLGLSQGVHGYDIFSNKKDGAIKVTLDPWQ